MLAYEMGVQALDTEQFNEICKSHVEEMRRFERMFFSKRTALKKKENDWLALHETYPESLGFARSLESGFYIVTTKDKDSVERISERDGYAHNILGIYSREISENKKDLLEYLIQEKEIDLRESELVFIDDSSAHLADVEELKITPFFASWGYEGHESRFPRLVNLEELAF